MVDVRNWRAGVCQIIICKEENKVEIQVGSSVSIRGVCSLPCPTCEDSTMLLWIGGSQGDLAWSQGGPEWCERCRFASHCLGVTGRKQ